MKLFKKAIITMSITLAVGLFSSFSYGLSDDYLNVKIGGSISKDGNSKIYSKDGFSIFRIGDTDGEVDYISSSEVKIGTDDSGELILLDEDADREYRLDGYMVKASSGGTKINGKNYRGYIFFLNKGGQVQPINYVQMDDYLYGVLSKEVGSSFPSEALKAQAVASRSFAYANKNKHKSEGFNVCDTTHCQVYGGMDSEHANLNAAVDSTRGQYAYYNGNIADTTFHSNNGGHMESSKNEWGGDQGYLIQKEDPFSKNTLNSEWTVEFTMDQLESKFKSSGVNVGTLKSIKIEELTDGNRVKKLRLIGTDKEEVITGSKLRGALGLKSTYVTLDSKTGSTVNVPQGKDTIYVQDSSGDVKEALAGFIAIDDRYDEVKIKEDYYVRGSLENRKIENSGKSLSGGNIISGNTIVINGRGYGHGVGMSQHGAVEMGKQGYSYLEILEHYYPGIEIR